MYIKKKNGKIIKIKTPWDIMNEQAPLIIKANITSGVGGDVGGGSGSLSP